MNGVLATGLIWVALGAALWAAVLTVAGSPVQLRAWHGLGLYGVLAVLELALVAQLVVGVGALAGTDREVDGLSFVGYLVGAVLVLPLAAVWALAERTRWGPSVAVVGCLTVPVLVVRLRQLWEAHV